MSRVDITCHFVQQAVQHAFVESVGIYVFEDFYHTSIPNTIKNRNTPRPGCGKKFGQKVIANMLEAIAEQ